MKICVNNPIWFEKKNTENYLGARYEFVLKYADALYFSHKKYFFKWLLKADLETKKEVFLHKKIIFDVSVINNNYDIFVTLNVPPIKNYNFNSDIKIMKVNAVYDYNFEIENLKNKLQDSSTDFLIGHARHDVYDPFFQKYFTRYNGRVIPFPFGYRTKLLDYRYREEKINRIVGMGAITPIASTREINTLKEYYEFLHDKRRYSHLERGWFREHSSDLKEVFDSYFPELPSFRNLLNDEQKLLTQYQYFLNDLGSLIFLPARMYEGIALGSIPFVLRHPIYKEYGFDETNAVFFDELDVKHITDVFRAIEDPLSKSIRAQSLAKRYTFEAVSEKLYSDLESLCMSGKIHQVER